MTKTNTPIPTLSLFSGAGGLDLGFEHAGFKIVACVEIEAAYCATLGRNSRINFPFFKHAEIFCQDIEGFDPAPFKSMGIKCVIGGPPCQTFSAAGRRSGGVIGTKDDRGRLYNAYCRVLDTLKPDVFVFENVYGLPGANGGKPWEEIVAAFRQHGYKLHYDVLDSADYGVPQHRERLILVGTKSKKYTFPLPTHGPDSLSGAPLVSVWEAIKDLQKRNEPYRKNLRGLYGHLLPDIPEGLNYAFFTAEMGHPEPVFAWRSKFHDLLYKVNRDEPCRTIKAQPGQFTGPFHWKNRHFTVAELKRLQTFPDDYEIVGSYGKVIEQVGNSVPPRLAYVIAMSVKEQLLDVRTKQTFKVRTGEFSSTFRSRQRERSKQFKKIASAAIKKRYGSTKSPAALAPKSSAKDESYHVLHDDFWSREVIRRPSSIKKGALVNIVGAKRSINIKYAPNSGGGKQTKATFKICGLSKYLPSYDTLVLKGNAGHRDDIFHMWQEVEMALVTRSRFFSLIDIYGHYANRGGAVEIKSAFCFPKDGAFERTLAFFSQTENCGNFYAERDVWSLLKVAQGEVNGVVQKMRDLRFDFRTSSTHPIIGKSRVLCTYPFPLLSPRAMVESKAAFNKSPSAIAKVG